MNIFHISGRLTNDPEEKQVGEYKVAEFTIATDSIKKGGEKQSNFLEMKAWGKTAETILKYLQKGDQIITFGEIRQERWKDKENKNRSKIVFIVNRFEFGAKSKNSDRGTTPEPEQDTPDQGWDAGGSGDDMPF